MEREQAQAEQLVLVHEVTDVGAGEARAGGAVAAVLERRLVAREAGVADVEPALAVSAVPLRAVRVGSTQSNMSMPASITSRIPSGSPMPMK